MATTYIVAKDRIATYQAQVRHACVGKHTRGSKNSAVVSMNLIYQALGSNETILVEDGLDQSILCCGFWTQCVGCESNAQSKLGNAQKNRPAQTSVTKRPHYSSVIFRSDLVNLKAQPKRCHLIVQHGASRRGFCGARRGLG